MAAPVAGDANLPPQNPDLQPINNDNRILFDSAEDDFTISQLAKSIGSHHPPPPPPAPLTSSLGKRRKSKPVRYGVSTTVVEKTDSPPQHNVVAYGHSNKALSSQKETSATKSLKSPVEISPAMIRAREFQSSLGTEHPSCIKLMLKAHVGSGYWMGFSLMFGKCYLPKIDTEMAVEDESGEISHIRYNADKSGLSAGWKKFADGHKLVEGDVLIFHLVEACKFKVYIIRANDDQNQVNENLLNSETHTEQIVPETDSSMITPPPKSKTKKSKRPKSFPLTMARKKHKSSTPALNEQNSGNDSEEVGSEVLEGSRPDHSFQEVKSFEDFHIMVNGECIDSELPDEVRMVYYDLCNNRKEFLHDAISEGTYSKLVVGMIGETVNIAKEIKKCTHMTTEEEFEAWDKSLKSFALLGMKVGFIQDAVHSLSTLVRQKKEVHKRYLEVEDELKRITLKILEDEDKLKKLDDRLRAKAQAPW